MLQLAAVTAVALAAIALAPTMSTAQAGGNRVAPAVPATPATPVAHAVMSHIAPPALPAPPDAPEAPAPPAERRSRERAREEASGPRAWLGVMLSGEDGTRIGSVSEESPAEEAGLKRGDRIVEIDGKEIRYANDILRTMRSMSPGDRVRVRVERDGGEKTLSVTLGERPEPRREFRLRTPDHEIEMNDDDESGDDNDEEGEEIHRHGDHHDSGDRGENGDDGDREKVIIMGPDGHMRHMGPMGPMGHMGMMGGSRNYLGVEILQMSEALREAMKAPRDKGVLVNQVVEGSPADEAGMRAGDVIVGVGDESIEDTGDIGSALSDHDAGDEVSVQVIRNGSERTMKIKVARRPGPSGRRGALPPGTNREWIGLSEKDKQELQRTIERAMEQAHEAMRQVHEQMKEHGQEMKIMQEQLREQSRKIKEQIRQEIQGGRSTVRASNVFDI